jgi:hypothetical protein
MVPGRAMEFSVGHTLHVMAFHSVSSRIDDGLCENESRAAARWVRRNEGAVLGADSKVGFQDGGQVSFLLPWILGSICLEGEYWRVLVVRPQSVGASVPCNLSSNLGYAPYGEVCRYPYYRENYLIIYLKWISWLDLSA